MKLTDLYLFAIQAIKVQQSLCNFDDSFQYEPMNSSYHIDNFAYKSKNSRQNNYFKTTRLQDGNKAKVYLLQNYYKN